jgi:hypothetical protein
MKDHAKAFHYEINQLKRVSARLGSLADQLSPSLSREVYFSSEAVARWRVRVGAEPFADRGAL